jgi:hypothetical protein
VVKPVIETVAKGGHDRMTEIGVESEAGRSAESLVRLDLGEGAVFLAARQVSTRPEPGTEREIADYQPRLEKALTGLADFARRLAGTLEDTGAEKVAIEFGCELALESGSFVAVIGKASTNATFKVALEWVKPPE